MVGETMKNRNERDKRRKRLLYGKGCFGNGKNQMHSREKIKARLRNARKSWNNAINKGNIQIARKRSAQITMMNRTLNFVSMGKRHQNRG